MEFLQSMLGTLRGETQSVGQAIYEYALVMAAVGTLVMALLEAVKELVRLRWWFNRWQVRRWMGSDRQALLEFHVLASGSVDSTAGLYDQPVEKMMAQVQAAGNLALEYPDVYPAAYRFFTDLSGVQKASDSQGARRLGPDDATAYLDLLQAGAAEQWDDLDTRKKLAFAQVKARLSNLVTRKLDMFQTRTQHTWALCNQAASVLLAGLLVVYILAATTKAPPLWIAAWGLFGGLLAPVAKDLVSGLKSFARGR